MLHILAFWKEFWHSLDSDNLDGVEWLHRHLESECNVRVKVRDIKKITSTRHLLQFAQVFGRFNCLNYDLGILIEAYDATVNASGPTRVAHWRARRQSASSPADLYLFFICRCC